MENTVETNQKKVTIRKCFRRASSNSYYQNKTKEQALNSTLLYQNKEKYADKIEKSQIFNLRFKMLEQKRFENESDSKLLQQREKLYKILEKMNKETKRLAHQFLFQKQKESWKMPRKVKKGNENISPPVEKLHQKQNKKISLYQGHLRNDKSSLDLLQKQFHHLEDQKLKFQDKIFSNSNRQAEIQTLQEMVRLRKNQIHELKYQVNNGQFLQNQNRQNDFQSIEGLAHKIRKKKYHNNQKSQQFQQINKKNRQLQNKIIKLNIHQIDQDRQLLIQDNQNMIVKHNYLKRKIEALKNAKQSDDRKWKNIYNNKMKQIVSKYDKIKEINKNLKKVNQQKSSPSQNHVKSLKTDTSFFQ